MSNTTSDNIAYVKGAYYSLNGFVEVFLSFL